MVQVNCFLSILNVHFSHTSLTSDLKEAYQIIEKFVNLKSITDHKMFQSKQQERCETCTLKHILSCSHLWAHAALSPTFLHASIFNHTSYTHWPSSILSASQREDQEKYLASPNLRQSSSVNLHWGISLSWSTHAHAHTHTLKAAQNHYLHWKSIHKSAKGQFISAS